MAVPRIDATQVKEIITTSLADNVITTNMIVTAHIFIDEHLLSVGHSEALLAKIELYLSAHFVAVSEDEGTLSLSTLGDATDAWDNSNLGKGLNSTRFGQQALALDASGVLTGLGIGNLKSQFRVV